MNIVAYPYLESTLQSGIKLGLEGIGRDLEAFHSPQLSYQSVHIAGTNGKGTVSRLIHYFLNTVGSKTGLYTSPHLVDVRERVCIGHDQIDEKLFRKILDKIQNVLRPDRTYFETLTLLALEAFAQEQCEWAVLEIGLGGRLDATNVVDSHFQVFTKIDLDHTDILGLTPVEIAHEKAGIIKPHSVIYSFEQYPEVKEVLEHYISQSQSCLFYMGCDWKWEIIEKNKQSQDVLVEFPEEKYIFHNFPILGEHQAANLSLAFAVFRHIQNQKQVVLKNEWDMSVFSWEGRSDWKVRNQRQFFLDGAHNPAAIQALCHVLSEMQKHKFHFIFGVLSTKDWQSMLNQIAQYASSIHFVPFEYPKAVTPIVLAEYWNRHYQHIPMNIYPSLDTLFNGISTWDDGLVVITGSFYLLGEIKARGYFS